MPAALISSRQGDPPAGFRVSYPLDIPIIITSEDKKVKIKVLEETMLLPDFWADKNRAQAVIKEIQELKLEAKGGSKYDAGDAVMTIFSGAGGDDAEDFSAMLFSMYWKYFKGKGWKLAIIHENQNDHGGFAISLWKFPAPRQSSGQVKEFMARSKMNPACTALFAFLPSMPSENISAEFFNFV